MRTVSELLKDVHDDCDFSKSEDFFADGLFDSFDLMVLMVLINSEYNITLPPEECMPNNFYNLKKICNALKKYGVGDNYLC